MRDKFTMKNFPSIQLNQMTGKIVRFLYRILTVSLFVLTVMAVSALAQNHPELKWFTFESEHFVYHYHEGTERTVQQALIIAEEVYPHVTALYDFEPATKTHVIIQDTDDYANGGAYYFDNKILLWASPLQFDLRGNHNWIRNVFTHEFAHIVSLGKAMKFPISTPAAFIQVLDREKPFRDNIVMEYPRGIAAFPVSNVTVPMWWAEGVAQYQFKESTYDYWDSHRDMLLRDQALNGKLLSYDEAGHFGKKETGNESVYNTGFAFVNWLAEKYGPEINKKIADVAAKPANYSFNRALKEATGIAGRTLWREWQENITQSYHQQTETIRNNGRSGDIVLESAPSYFFTEIAPDESKIVFAASEKADYIGMTSLYLYDSGKPKKLSGNTRGNMAFSADGQKLYYAGRQKETILQSTWFDLMEYDFISEKESRLTRNARIYSVATSPDGNIYVVAVRDGTHNIYQFHSMDSLTALTNFHDGQQIFTLRAEPDGQGLIFDLALVHGRGIYRFSLADSLIRPIIRNDFDNRHPVLAADGKTMIFSSDQSGIFNLYRHHFDSEETELISNVTGAAFYPAIHNESGEIWFTLFQDGRFRLAKLTESAAIEPELAFYREYAIPKENYDPAETAEFEAHPYQQQFSRFFAMPFVMWDYDALKVGGVMFQNEILDRFNLYAQAGMNGRTDADLYASLEFNGFLPTLYWENYYMTYHLDAQRGKIYDFYPEENTYSFSLWESLAGLRYIWRKQLFELSASYGQYNAHIKSRQEIIPGKPQMFTYGYTYFKGGKIEFRQAADRVAPTWQSDIHPLVGFDYDLRLGYDFNRFITGFGINSDFGTLQEKYKKDNTIRAELSAGFYLPDPILRKSALSFTLNAGWLENSAVDSFFHFFGGGMPGLKGYPYYAIEGTNKAVFTSTYRFPLIAKMNLTLEPFTLDRVYFAVFHQIGDAWRGSFWNENWYQKDQFAEALQAGVLGANWKQDIGAQLRIGGWSYYAYPLAMTLEAVYGLDEFLVYDKNMGGSWRFYWSILFEFQRRQWER
jgi:hypothetical protein